MKISITGHTSGIGLAIYDKLLDLDYKVQGFSRSNHYDIDKDRDKIIKKSKNYDVFINNACHSWSQVDLLYEFFEQWQNQDKIIINISSHKNNEIPFFRYSVKRTLDKACEQLQNIEHKCRIINLKPGYVKTGLIDYLDVNKLAPQDVANIIIWLIRQPNHIYIKNISMEHV